MYDTQTNRVNFFVYFMGILFCFFVVSCNRKNEKMKEIEKWQQKMDEMANTQLDSIYKKQSLECDSLQRIGISKVVDSLMKNSGYLKWSK